MRVLCDSLNNISDYLYSDLIYRIAEEIYPEGVCRRREKQCVHRGVVITRGPNATWSMDGYCKLDFCGIEVYGAIDAYSRFGSIARTIQLVY